MLLSQWNFIVFSGVTGIYVATIGITSSEIFHFYRRWLVASLLNSAGLLPKVWGEGEGEDISNSHTRGVKIQCPGEYQRNMFCMSSLPQKRIASSAWLMIMTCQIPAWVINNKKGLMGLDRQTDRSVMVLALSLPWNIGVLFPVCIEIHWAQYENNVTDAFLAYWQIRCIVSGLVFGFNVRERKTLSTGSRAASIWQDGAGEFAVSQWAFLTRLGSWSVSDTSPVCDLFSL